MDEWWDAELCIRDPSKEEYGAPLRVHVDVDLNEEVLESFQARRLTNHGVTSVAANASQKRKVHLLD
jgi:hypothetical protein